MLIRSIDRIETAEIMSLSTTRVVHDQRRCIYLGRPNQLSLAFHSQGRSIRRNVMGKIEEVSYEFLKIIQKKILNLTGPYLKKEQILQSMKIK